MPIASKEDEGMMYYLGRHFNTAAALFRTIASENADPIVRLDFETRAAIAAFYAGDSTHISSFAETLRNSRPSHIYAYHLARLMHASGDSDGAMEQLESAVESGMPFMAGYFDADVFLVPLAVQHRFQRLTGARD
jgi:hypothetical protein